MSRTNSTFLRRHIFETKVSKAPPYRAAFDFLGRRILLGQAEARLESRLPFFEGWQQCGDTGRWKIDPSSSSESDWT